MNLQLFIRPPRQPRTEPFVAIKNWKPILHSGEWASTFILATRRQPQNTLHPIGQSRLSKATNHYSWRQLFRMSFLGFSGERKIIVNAISMLCRSTKRNQFQSHVPLAVILHSLWGIGYKLSAANIGSFFETSKSFPSFFNFGRKIASRHFHVACLCTLKDTYELN